MRLDTAAELPTHQWMHFGVFVHRFIDHPKQVSLFKKGNVFVKITMTSLGISIPPARKDLQFSGLKGVEREQRDSALVKSRTIRGVYHAPVAQLDRAPGFEPGGRGFESLRARHFAP